MDLLERLRRAKLVALVIAARYPARVHDAVANLYRTFPDQRANVELVEKVLIARGHRT